MKRTLFSITVQENTDKQEAVTTIKQALGSSASVVVTSRGNDMDVSATIENIPNPPLSDYDDRRNKW